MHGETVEMDRISTSVQCGLMPAYGMFSSLLTTHSYNLPPKQTRYGVNGEAAASARNILLYDDVQILTEMFNFQVKMIED